VEAALTVTAKEHCAELLDVSVTLQITVVTPIGKLEPEDGTHTVVADEQLSLPNGCV
jgi:hypothetical protein